MADFFFSNLLFPLQLHPAISVLP